MKQVHSARAALIGAIESKVERMDMAGPLDLATALNVPVPAAAKAILRRERKPSTRSFAGENRVLRGSGIGPVASAAEGSKLLDAIAVDEESADWVESDLVGAGELVERLNIFARDARHLAQGEQDNRLAQRPSQLPLPASAVRAAEARRGS